MVGPGAMAPVDSCSSALLGALGDNVGYAPQNHPTHGAKIGAVYSSVAIGHWQRATPRRSSFSDPTGLRSV